MMEGVISARGGVADRIITPIAVSKSPETENVTVHRQRDFIVVIKVSV